MNKVKRNFKASVNIKFDLGKKEFFRDYLPTPSHAESLQNILEGFNNEDSKRAHIIVGPYGTGKSLLGTLIGSMASRSVHESEMKFLTKKFNNVDDKVYNELIKFQSSQKQYLPVILNGNEGSFRQSIISAIMRTLEEYNLDIIVPGIISKIFNMIDTWEVNFPKTYRSFKRLLKESGRDIELWRVNIQSYDRQEIQWFKEIFPLLSSGAEFSIDYKEDFIEQLKFVIGELEKQNIGLFIVYDEFGRFLQSINTTMIHETMQDLQDLAELTDNYARHLHLLFITHKNLRHYFFKLSEEYQNEFQRIEKRFNLYHIDSDRSTFIRITDSILSEFDGNEISPEEAISVRSELRKYPLFSNLNQVEVERLVIKGAYPIHPVTLFLLPHLSNKFAQNERTLFTFLQNHDTGGLVQHIENKDDYYLPSELFDFFFSNLEFEDYIEDKSLQMYKKLEGRIPQGRQDLVHLFKFITLWTMSNLNSSQKLTNEFLSFAINKRITTTKDLLLELTNLKVIRFNRILELWELFEGSSIDLDYEVELRRETINLSHNHIKTLMEDAIRKRFFLANDYNDHKSMTRFATVNICLSSEIIEGTFNPKEIRKEMKADAVVHYVILENIRDYQRVTDLIINHANDEFSYFTIANKSLEDIYNLISDYYVLTSLESDLNFIKNDKDLKKEISLRLEDLLHSIRRFMSSYTSFGQELKWIHNGSELLIKNDIVLEKELSNLMYSLYPLTPEVRNDSFVRRKINSVQKKAAYSVLDHILTDYPNSLQLEGNGPDYLIYATIFKNNKLDISDLSNIKSADLKEIRTRLLKKLKQDTEGRLSDLSSILEDKPFGIRTPLIPLLLVSLIRDKWGQIMFYRNGMYVPGLTGEKLYQMLEEASEYTFVYFDFNEKYEPLFNEIKTTFGMYVSDNAMNSSMPIMLSSGLLNWLRSLPRFTQITTRVGKELEDFRDTVKRSEIDPRATLETLYHMYRNDLNLLREHKQKLELFLDEYKSELEIKVFLLLNVSNFHELYKWADSMSAIVKKNNTLVNGIMQSDEDGWIEKLTLNVVGVPLKDWSDTTNQMFEQLLLKDYNSTSYALPKGDYLTISLNGEDKSITKVDLSTKTQTIYKNVHRMIKNAGRNVPKEEVEYMIYNLVKEFVK
ncbi:hypothetical protein ACPJHQ_05500 [Rossellomorea sp. H39__3]